MPLVDPVTMSSVSSPPSSSSSPSPSPSSFSSSVIPSKAPSAAGKSTDPSQRQQPVRLKTTVAAQAARHVSPVVLAGLSTAGFGYLVASPVSTMWAALPVVASLQFLHATVCLPAAGSSGAAKPRKQRPGDKKRAATEGSGPNLIITALLSLLLSVLLTPILHAVMILFGAPLLTHVSHTFLCAAHLSLLTSFPLFYVHGIDPAVWTSLAGFKAPLDECYGGLLGGFLGAWLGAVPIPLDWDREWQKWPVTILVGIYAGCLVGRLLGGTLLWGKRF